MKNPNIPDHLYYLDDDFYVRSLKKHQLKEILTAHHIPYLESLTRQDLIKLFKKHIEENREQILREYGSKKQDNRINKELKQNQRIPDKPIKQQNESSSHSKAASKDKDGFVIPAIPAKRAKQKFTAEESFGEESESDVARKNIENIRVKSEPTRKILRDTNKQITKPKKPVTSSPPTFNPEDSFASNDDDDDEEEKEDSHTIQEKAPASPPIKSEEFSVHPQDIKLKHDDKEYDDDDDDDYFADSDGSNSEDDEDFDEIDKKELVELYKEQSVSLDKLTKPQHQIFTRSQAIAIAKNKALLWKLKLKRIGTIFCLTYMLVALLGFSITTYARKQNGYCQNYPVDASNKTTSFIFSLLPKSCIPCPHHGICTNGDLTCDTLYERKRPFYNVGNLMPIADECVHNSVLGKYVSKVEKKIKKQLTIQQSDIVCRHLLSHPNSKISDVPVSHVKVKDLLASTKLAVESYLPSDKLNEIMLIALSSVLEDPEVHFREIDDENYFGTTHVELSFACQAKRLYINTPLYIKIYMIALISIIVAIYGALKDYKRSLNYKEKINELVKLTLGQLKEQYDNHLKDPVLYTSPSIPVSQLRSKILDINDQKTIQDWQNVAEIIENNPHIRKSFQEIRGDPIEYWELTQ